MPKNYKNLVGTHLKFLVVLSESHVGENYRRYWNCRCICGATCVIRGDILTSNVNVNCGCQSGKLRSRSAIEPNKQANISRIYRQYKKRGAQSGKGFSLTKDEFEDLIFDNCYYCGSAPNNCNKIKTKFDISELIYNGIDGVDNSKGYHIGNCVTCCITCNVAKSNMSFDNFVKWVEAIYKFLIPKIR